MRDDDNVVADRADLGKDMARDYNSLKSSELADEISDLDDLRGVKTYRGLVEDDNVGLTDHRLRDTNTLTVTL